MEIKYYGELPEEAKNIRTKVFVEEQGFREEFDGTDEYATHIVIFEDGLPVSTCRFFYSPEKGGYMIGRIAVSRCFRGKGYGKTIVEAAEKAIKSKGAKKVYISSQCRASGFYGKLGYECIGDIYDDEGCPHILMSKNIQ